MKCHNLLLQECIVNCEICKNQTERRLTFVFDKKKYPTLTYKMIQHQVRHKTKYICKSCHKKLEPKVNCVCCKLNIDFHLCRSYKMENCDFNKHIVSRCIPNIDEDDSDKYICLSCHGRLEKTDNENPVVPYNLKNTCVNAAAKVLKCLQEKPEYVCTCCHHMMFRKSVKHFHVNEYQMNNYIVRKSLSYHYRMKVYNGNNDLPPSNQYIQHEWPQMMNTNGENQDFNYMDEYICIRCKTNLQLKNPNMPDQACANGLNLDDIPKDLSDLFTIEWRLICYRLPFITIIIVRRYGGHYKVNGPPVNVPAKLDQIIDMLPQMPNQLQLYPVQLKCKLEYKSYYMYDMVWKDHVMGALMWLKQNNYYYKDMSINEHWSNDVSDHGVLEICIDEQNAQREQVQNGNTETYSEYEKISSLPITQTNTIPETEQQEQILNEIDNEENNDIDESLIDEELAQDQAAIDRKQHMIGDALPSVVEIDNMENTVFQCAPGENNIPKYVLMKILKF